MNYINYYNGAFVNFDRFMVAVVRGKRDTKPIQLGSRAEISKSLSSLKIPLTSTIKRLPNYMGFFTSAVLQTSLVSLNRLLGRKDRVSGNVHIPLMAESRPTIQDRRVQSEASLTRNRIERLPLVNAVLMNGIKREPLGLCLCSL